MSYDHPREGTDDGAIWPLLSAVRKRWWLLFVLVLAAVGAAAVGLSNRTPSYTATAQILVTPYPQQSDSSLAGIRLLRDSGDGARNLLTATTLLTSSQNDAAAARRLGEGDGEGEGAITAADVGASVVVEPVGGSDVIAVSATADDPKLAAAMANAYAAAALAARDAEVERQARSAIKAIDGRDEASLAAPREQLRTLRDQGDPTLSLTQPANVPTSADGPSDKMVLIAAIIVGLVLGVIGAFLLERGDRRVRDRSELLRRIPVPVLTGVPSPRGHRGIDMPPPVREAFRTLQIQLDMQGRPGCRRILVTSASSGDGKTTTVLNLAFALVGAGKRVIVIDFDLRKPELAPQLGLERIDALASTLTAGTPLSAIMRAAPRLAPLRVVQVSSGTGDVALLPQLVGRMQSVLQEAAELADYVLIDTAPLGEVGDALPIIEFVDDVLLVGRPGSTDRRAIDTMAGLFERSGVRPLGWVVAGVETSPSSYYEKPKRSSRFRRASKV